MGLGKSSRKERTQDVLNRFYFFPAPPLSSSSPVNRRLSKKKLRSTRMIVSVGQGGSQGIAAAHSVRRCLFGLEKLLHKGKGEMKVIRRLLLSVNRDLCSQFQRSLVIRNFSASPIFDDKYNSGSSDLDFEQLIGQKNGPHMNSFYRKLDKAEKSYDRYGVGSNFNAGVGSGQLDGLNDGFSTLNDGLTHKLKQAATYFEHDPVEVNQENYAFRPDVNLLGGMTYDTKDLDLRKPGVRKPGKRYKFETTTEEVLRKADFRNVKFLANFLTEAGIIIKRSKTGISAKAQRKIAREIKTARAFGLMPFTTMGTKQFTYGRTMENEDADFGYEIYEHDFVENDSQET